MQNAANMKHRSDEEAFVSTASLLLKVHEKYNLFLHSGHSRTHNFQTAYIDPIVRALKQIVNIFKYGMDKVVFRGLDEAMTQVDIIIGPHRNTMNVIVKRMVTNTELVSLHVGNFIQYDFKHDDLDDLLKTSIRDISIVEETLPIYYNIVLDIPQTMKRLNFDYNAFSFTPQRLARQSEKCHNDVYQFTNDTRKIKSNLTSLLEKWKTWNSSTNDADVKTILKNLDVNLHKYETRFELLKENCFDNFTDAVQEIRKLNESHQEQVDVFTDIEYTFNFAEESQDIKTEERSFEWLLIQFLKLGNMTKNELEENLTEDGMDERITTIDNFINKVKFRLTERLRMGLDKARDDITDWYKDVLVKVAHMTEFMSPNFLEERLSQMDIWKSPVVMLFQEDQLENTCKFLLVDILTELHNKS